MNNNRRNFLKQSGVASLALALPLASNANSWLDIFDPQKKAQPFGIQLYSLRDEMPKDPAGVIKQLASFGYKQIETYDGPQGMFWNMGNKGFKKFIEDLGIKMHSVHTDVFKDYEKKVNELAEVGIDYIVYNWEGPNKTLEDYKKMAEDFNTKGEYANKLGVKLAFHNHDYTFKKLSGEYGQDVLMKGTDAKLVDFEMDMYWVVTAGENPIEWMDKYPGRFKLCHIKDRAKGTKEIFDSCTLGKGSIDYATILKGAKKRGMKYFYAEQEKYDGTTQIQSAKDNALYLKKILKAK
jgi:sugar phosphate isomerase/epimerase